MGLAPGGRPLVDGYPSAHVGCFGALVPSGVYCRIQGRSGPDVPVLGSDGSLIPFFNQISAPELQGVHAQFAGDYIDVGLQGEHGLRFSRGPHKTTRHGVGVDLHPFDFHVGNLIRTAGFGSPAQVHAGGGLETPVGAAVEVNLDLVGHDGAVALDSGF